ncbi:tubulin epsilon and delta complex protein 1-like [Phymastichus coffea]|uniref:tubulin epsilon and delta complex protein 1-like n=1 Tax=Phymastichus coffea TaxID=108790 RepID=UPI00273B7089|nr:tubulin epsilon and delta complex protein 1-like [Phymastichus coffea]
MLDIKEVITLLCKYLNDTVDSTLNPEHFRLAKYDNDSDAVIDAFWTTLDKLTHFALSQINDRISFAEFDKCIRTKLRLSYLQYPLVDIYSTSNTPKNSNSKSLLLALAWIITKYDVLKNIVRLKLLNSSLGREFSKVNADLPTESEDAELISIQNQIHSLLQKTNKLSGNIKAISELYCEKVKLMTKVHAASITASGLPHLSVSEMALIKKIATSRDDKQVIGSNIHEKLKEMEKTASMLDTHMKWTRRSHVFHTWMSTVLDTCENTERSTLSDYALAELARFIYLLRHIIKDRLNFLKISHDHISLKRLLEDCPSKLLRVQKCFTETHHCLTKMTHQFDSTDENLQKKRVELEKELKFILNFIPDCVLI